MLRPLYVFEIIMWDEKRRYVRATWDYCSVQRMQALFPDNSVWSVRNIDSLPKGYELDMTIDD